MIHLLREQWGELLGALRFLTTLPLPHEKETNEWRLGGGFFPLVGLLLGGCLSILALLLGWRLSYLPLTALLIVAEIVLTGGLHLDGLMDSCDGLFGGHTRERRLEIMKDSRVGSFGVLGAICVVLLKWACLTGLPVTRMVPALLMTLTMSRWMMLLALFAYPNARPEGMGDAFRQRVTRGTLILAGVTALAVTLIVGFFLGPWGFLKGLQVFLLGTGFAFVLGWPFYRMIGGLTGDSYGAIVELAEVALLLLFLWL
ncbi:cobalamin-5'-phosphate synthase [Thermosporothrix hazakensis]|uniref:Adenosylcobinamide-GDP ribazoletransferase n=1 Tax=Thermosporothrix hazakensis TaxID=644383 RepID=A0A326U4A3_THEHA|nr:adenosylcobinamide-GDP ribazoletransferase [Thermosporothrix hazakensis]PZW27464.1 cobalamin-5'-phosphate synthase [Thermosporothrix hazakensis]GCE45630.1 adenosylcobinamide-GDP ribazoletransferase [Thermosporothrix hazakensis]